MRQLFLGPIASVALVAIGGAAFAWQAGHYRNLAGPITGSYSVGINGTFRVEADPSGIPSDRYGGACIVFRAKDLGFTEMQHKNCRKDGDCDAGGHSGYCDVSNGKCWAKPVLPDPGSADAAVCRRSNEATPPIQWAPGVNNPISEQPIPIASLGVHPNAKARVLTCLHGIPFGGCVNPDLPSQHDWGDPKQL